MEYPLGRGNRETNKPDIKCLNPSFNGIPSRAITQLQGLFAQKVVLILLLMEYPLGRRLVSGS